MSHYPPPGGSGGPPPYYSGYNQPPYPPPGSFAYVPAPIMMPVPGMPPPDQPPSNTYVTNIIYHGPQQAPIDDASMIDWLPASSSTAMNYSARAVVGGYEGWGSAPLWVIRARYGGDCIPGKFAVNHNSAYIAFDGKETRVFDFEIMVAEPHLVRWIPSSNGSIPPGAFPAGNTGNGEPLYIGRARHGSSLIPGKIHPSHGSCYIPYGGAEVAYRHYEVLCRV